MSLVREMSETSETPDDVKGRISFSVKSGYDGQNFLAHLPEKVPNICVPE